MKRRLYKLIFKWITSKIIGDCFMHNSDTKFSYENYYIKEFYNKTNHKTGDDITIVFDDLLWRK